VTIGFSGMTPRVAAWSSSLALLGRRSFAGLSALRRWRGCVLR
jgi:hypothetical protein